MREKTRQPVKGSDLAPAPGVPENTSPPRPQDSADRVQSSPSLACPSLIPNKRMDRSRGKGGFSAPLCFDLPPSSGVSDLSGFWRQETTTDVINMAEVLSFKKPESETFPVAWASWFRKAPGVPYSRVLGGPFPCRLMEAGAREMPGGRTRGGVLSLCPPFRRPHVPTTRDGGRDSWG